MLYLSKNSMYKYCNFFKCQLILTDKYFSNFWTFHLTNYKFIN